MTKVQFMLKWSGRWVVVALMMVPLLMSCQPKSDTSTVSETGQIATESPAWPSTKLEGKESAPDSVRLSQKITFRQSNGVPEFSLQFKPTGGKLLDGAGKVIANLILESDGALRLTDVSNAVVGYVVRTESSIRIESPKRSKTLFSFAQGSDGNALLTRNNGSTVYQLNATDDGYEIATDKAALYIVSARKGIGQLQTSEGQTLMSSEGAIAPSAIAAFGFDKLTQAQQAGLAYMLSAEAI